MGEEAGGEEEELRILLENVGPLVWPISSKKKKKKKPQTLKA